MGLFLTQLIGFGVGGLTTTLIPGGTGTAIGNMTSNGGLAAAFDGNTSQADAACALIVATTNGFVNGVGKDWGAGNTKIITRVTAWTSTDSPFRGDGAVDWKFQGSTDNFSGSIVDLASGTTAGGAGESVDTPAASIITTTAYRYHRWVINGNAVNSGRIAELQMYEDI